MNHDLRDNGNHSCGSCVFGRHDNCAMEKVPISARITTYAGTPGEHYRCACASLDQGASAQPHLLEGLTS